MTAPAAPSSLAEKALVGLTGLALASYLVLHLLGNLLLFAGPATFNGYAHALVSNPLVVPAEVGLAALFGLHAWRTLVLWWRNRQARPVPYVRRARAGGASRKTLASTTMIYSGLATAAFVVVHVRAFKYGPARTLAGERDLFGLVTGYFGDPVHVVLYEASLVLIGLHLWHGVASAVESVGGGGPRASRWALKAGHVLAALVAAGFLALPVWGLLRGGGR